MLFLATNPFLTAVEPIVSLINMAVGPALMIVGALGSLYCILLGVKLAKAEEPQDREKAKGSLKNAIIGFLMIFVLLVVLNVAMKPMTEWMESSTGNALTVETGSSK